MPPVSADLAPSAAPDDSLARHAGCAAKPRPQGCPTVDMSSALGQATIAAHIGPVAPAVKVRCSRTGWHHADRDIRLPRHIGAESYVAVDIGGSLAKLVYVTRDEHSRELGDKLHFVSFETTSVDDCVKFMGHLKAEQLALNGSAPGDLRVVATGGGAFKFYDRIREALGVEVQRGEEMHCLITGLDFFITQIPREVFTYTDAGAMQFVPPRADSYPYMLVNIGSGVSMLKVSGPGKWERVGGTSLGGATFRGILSLLTPAKSFDEMLEMAAHGDNKKVDMLVGDIYGTDYNKIGLKSTAIASSFGKVFRQNQETSHDTAGGSAPSSAEPSGDAQFSDDADPTRPDFDAADLSRALLYAISNNISQIAFLQSQIHGLSDIYFGGSFINGHPQTIERISVAIKYWSKGEKEAYFLRHEGYLGAVGAFLQPTCCDRAQS